VGWAEAAAVCGVGAGAGLGPRKALLSKVNSSAAELPAGGAGAGLGGGAAEPVAGVGGLLKALLSKLKSSADRDGLHLGIQRLNVLAQCWHNAGTTSAQCWHWSKGRL